MDIVTCTFCHRVYSAAEFLALPKTANGRDYCEAEGFRTYMRNCMCVPGGATLGLEVEIAAVNAEIANLENLLWLTPDLGRRFALLLQL